jgi:hypothetical protein
MMLNHESKILFDVCFGAMNFETISKLIFEMRNSGSANSVDLQAVVGPFSFNRLCEARESEDSG